MVIVIPGSTIQSITFTRWSQFHFQFIKHASHAECQKPATSNIVSHISSNLAPHPHPTQNVVSCFFISLNIWPLPLYIKIKYRYLIWVHLFDWLIHSDPPSDLLILAFYSTLYFVRTLEEELFIGLGKT